MRTVAIIQARMGSSRLPGKVLKDLAGDTALARVVCRTRRASKVDDVVVATTLNSEDESIVAECARLGVHCTRGDSEDVLDRYFRAANAFDAANVVRITSDCPLIDAGVIDAVIEEFCRSEADYASNTRTLTFPVGLDVEIFSFDVLAQAWRDAREAYQRSHVTAYIYEHPELFHLAGVAAKDDYSSHRWTLDTREDLAFLQEVFSRLQDPVGAAWTDVLRLVTDEHPELAAINGHIRQKALEEG